MFVYLLSVRVVVLFFFFNDTATTEIYTLSLHDALPISTGTDRVGRRGGVLRRRDGTAIGYRRRDREESVRTRAGQTRETSDRKSTRLNSSHSQISYAVFCLKKKKKRHTIYSQTINTF